MFFHSYPDSTAKTERRTHSAILSQNGEARPWAPAHGLDFVVGPHPHGGENSANCPTWKIKEREDHKKLKMPAPRVLNKKRLY
jgi:hypothetical protein